MLGMQVNFLNSERNELRRTGVMVCGECLRVFKDEDGEYLRHVYLEHQELHPMNTHTLSFLIGQKEEELGNDV